MPIDRIVANALEDLELDPLDSNGRAWEDSLTAGYGMSEVGASVACLCVPTPDACAASVLSCSCSSCCSI